MKKPSIVYHETKTGASFAHGLIFLSRKHKNSRYILRHELRHIWQYQNPVWKFVMEIAMLDNYIVWRVIMTFLVLLFGWVPYVMMVEVSALLMAVELDATIWAIRRTSEYETAFYGIATYFLSFLSVCLLIVAHYYPLVVLIVISIHYLQIKLSKSLE